MSHRFDALLRLVATAALVTLAIECWQIARAAVRFSNVYDAIAEARR